MARNTQFVTLQAMLRDEVGRSNQAGGAGVADFNQIKQLLNRHYERLYADYDWPHLRATFPRVPMAAGQRYYDIPAGLDYERIEQAIVWWGGRPQPFERGIQPADYQAFSSEDNERASPPLKWDVRNPTGTEQIEVWPIPSDSVASMQFWGIRKFTRLIAAADQCLLDDQLIVLFAAADLLADDEDQAKIKLNAAQSLFATLKKRTKGASKVQSFAKPAQDMRPQFIVLAR